MLLQSYSHLVTVGVSLLIVQLGHSGGSAMKKILLGSVALAAMFAGPAMAADIRVPPPPPPVVYYDWTGAYIGFNAGGVWSDVTRHFPNLANRS